MTTTGNLLTSLAATLRELADAYLERSSYAPTIVATDVLEERSATLRATARLVSAGMTEPDVAEAFIEAARSQLEALDAEDAERMDAVHRSRTIRRAQKEAARG